MNSINHFIFKDVDYATSTLIFLPLICQFLFQHQQVFGRIKYHQHDARHFHLLELILTSNKIELIFSLMIKIFNLNFILNLTIIIISSINLIISIYYH